MCFNGLSQKYNVNNLWMSLFGSFYNVLHIKMSASNPDDISARARGVGGRTTAVVPGDAGREARHHGWPQCRLHGALPHFRYTCTPQVRCHTVDKTAGSWYVVIGKRSF